VPVDGLAGLGLEPAVHLDGLFEHARGVARRSQLADESGRMPRRAVGELVLFEQHDVGLAVLRQPVGNAAAEDAATDDDDASALRKFVFGHGYIFTCEFVGS